MDIDEMEVKVLTPELSHFPKYNTFFKKSSKYFPDNIWQMEHIKISPEVNLEVGSKLQETLRKII